ncbi:MAG: SpoIIE family protein phosphatase [Bacteroidetes bacterium]|nr:SpoIIE family protein phosphatase [Bacteroidota bacterium]
MRICLSLIVVFIVLSAYGQKGTIILTNENLGNSFGDKVLILKDAGHQLTVEQVIQKPDSEFETLTDPVPNLDFTTARWWIKFSITNQSSNPNFILEVARPITNKAAFYQVRGEIIENSFVSGDDYEFSTKAIPHRKNLFPIYIETGETQSFILELESDGEVITLPIKIYDKISFFESDYFFQFTYGFYFGMMLLVVFIYFFFYVLLKDRSFLFYIMYVFCQAIMQFSLDGYSYQYFLPHGGYLANHIVLISASLTIVFLLFYVSAFLHLKENSPRLLRVYRYTLGFVILAFILSLIPGATYTISYPLINATSLLSVILTLVSIYILKSKGFKICNYFTVAFTVLILGAIIFILGNFNILGNAELAQNVLKFSSAIEVVILSISMSNKYRDLQREKEAAQAEAYKSLEEKNAMMDQINVKLEQQVKERTAKIEHQKEELAEINEEILSSIKYAKRIQEAILPAREYVKTLLSEYLVFYRPKDVVSGDFYFIESTHVSNEEQTPLVLFAAVDCTGHGVPGAFMSIVGNNYLSQSLTEKSVNSPAEALDFLNQGVYKALRQDGSQKEKGAAVRDGMDIALCALDRERNLLYFAGAKNPVYIVRQSGDAACFGTEITEKNLVKSENGEVHLYEIKGDKHPIGAFMDEELIPFTNKKISVQKGDMIYVFTDGFADQFGGTSLPESKGKGKKFTYKRFKQLLMNIASKPADEQHKILRNEFVSWKGETEQIDDVLVIGVRVS